MVELNKRTIMIQNISVHNKVAIKRHNAILLKKKKGNKDVSL
jgi:hypothetical protein